MESSLFTTQRKKLVFVGIFLVCVALLIGGEDNPGVLVEAQAGAGPQPVAETAQEAAEPAPAATTAQRRQNDASLAEWYAESPPPVAEPEPVDESHLINDAEPLVSTDPVR